MTPLTKSARHQRIVEIVTAHPVRSQTELADLLAAHGVRVTQATLSRDLVELDAVKIRTQSGALVYAVPAEGGDRRPAAPGESAAATHRLGRMCNELLVSADASANMVAAAPVRRCRRWSPRSRVFPARATTLRGTSRRRRPATMRVFPSGS
ncbi:MAG TPA: hypothetical protein VKO66_03355 [Sideroxyarcus sp.]|nr:hypothetical protein [Sideroxyarcus sp.]